MDFKVTPFNPRRGTPGDYEYRPDNNLQVVTGKDEIRQMVFYALLTRAKHFLYYEIGSELWTLPRDYTATEDTARKAEAMAIYALERQLPTEIKEINALATVVGDGLYLDVSYKITATGETDTVRITWEELQNA